MTTPPTTDADRVAEAVARCRSVAGLSDRTATYLPGRRVPGVAVRDGGPEPEVEVRVVGRWGPTVEEISREVRAAVGSVLPRHTLLLVIDDLDTGDLKAHDRDTGDREADSAHTGPDPPARAARRTRRI